MKVSGSIFSSEKSDVQEVITIAKELEGAGIDMLHYDHMDSGKLPIASIGDVKAATSLPIDVHLVVRNPYPIIAELNSHGVDYCAVQMENVERLDISRLRTFNGKLGLAFTPDTPLKSVEEHLDDLDYVLFMTSTPGLSGGKFNPQVFDNIREFKERHPGVPVFVDGGVDVSVSSTLKVLGADVIISGSYLQKGKSAFHQQHALMKNDYSLPISHLLQSSTPTVSKGANIHDVISTIDSHHLGAVCVVNQDGTFAGLITDGDVRRAFLKHESGFSKLMAGDMLLATPQTLDARATIGDLIELVNATTRPLLVVPVLDGRKLAGIVSLHNLLRMI